MKRWMWFAPFGAMVMFGGWIGWQMGIPRSDTVIINTYAADYVALTGAPIEDCEARPSDEAHVRMIIDCIRPDGAGYRYVVGPRGALVDRIIIQEPHT